VESVEATRIDWRQYATQRGRGADDFFETIEERTRSSRSHHGLVSHAVSARFTIFDGCGGGEPT